MKDVVVTYSDSEEFKLNLMDILTGGEKCRASQSALEVFLRLNSAEAVARRYIELLEIMLEEKRVGILPKFLKPGLDLKHRDQLHSQSAIQPQATNLQSPVRKGILKTEKIKKDESHQSTIPQ
jgi:hypothetical protein